MTAEGLGCCLFPVLACLLCFFPLCLPSPFSCLLKGRQLLAVSCCLPALQTQSHEDMRLNLLPSVVFVSLFSSWQF